MALLRQSETMKVDDNIFKPKLANLRVSHFFSSLFFDRFVFFYRSAKSTLDFGAKGLKVSRSQDLKVSRSQGLKVSGS